MLTTAPSGVADTLSWIEAARMVSRLPYGLVLSRLPNGLGVPAALRAGVAGLHGRVAFVDAVAAEMPGRPAGELHGTLLWVSVPRLNDAMCEARYRWGTRWPRGSAAWPSCC